MTKLPSDLTELELINEILLCDRKIARAVNHDNIARFNKEIMELGQTYVTKDMLLHELLKIRHM